MKMSIENKASRYYFYLVCLFCVAFAFVFIFVCNVLHNKYQLHSFSSIKLMSMRLQYAEQKRRNGKSYRISMNSNRFGFMFLFRVCLLCISTLSDRLRIPALLYAVFLSHHPFHFILVSLFFQSNSPHFFHF